MECVRISPSSCLLSTLKGEGALLCKKDTGVQNIAESLAPVAGPLVTGKALKYVRYILQNSCMSSGDWVEII